MLPAPVLHVKIFSPVMARSRERTQCFVKSLRPENVKISSPRPGGAAFHICPSLTQRRRGAETGPHRGRLIFRAETDGEADFPPWRLACGEGQPQRTPPKVGFPKSKALAKAPGPMPTSAERAPWRQTEKAFRPRLRSSVKYSRTAVAVFGWQTLSMDPKPRAGQD